MPKAITEATADKWITDLVQLSNLKPVAADAVFQPAFHASRRAVYRLAQEDAGTSRRSDTIFECQIKRIYEYRRQLLNALRTACG
jgi:glycogen phosphorylase